MPADRSRSPVILAPDPTSVPLLPADICAALHTDVELDQCVTQGMKASTLVIHVGQEIGSSGCAAHNRMGSISRHWSADCHMHVCLCKGGAAEGAQCCMLTI